VSKDTRNGKQCRGEKETEQIARIEKKNFKKKITNKKRGWK